MQNYEQLMNLYHGIKIGCGIAALVFLAAAIACFFIFKIPEVLGELSGRTAKKAIAEMKATDDGTGILKIGDDGRRHKKSKTTGSLSTGRLKKNTGNLKETVITPPPEEETSRMNPAVGQHPYNDHTYQTAAMNSGADETGVINTGAGETTVMNQGSSETTVLNDGINETMVLDTGAFNAYMMNKTPQNNKNSDVMFIIERSIVEIHTDEVI